MTMSDDPTRVSHATHPGRDDPHTAHVVDGNAVVGALEDLLAGDLSMLIVECGGCHTAAPLAEWQVEADRDAFIVRCRSCTHTLWTLMRTGDVPSLLIAGGCGLRRAPDDAERHPAG
ncbi:MULTISPECIES: DUF6510 family protein [unclassified Microbacterium]|uniref:DUF6510 family protein n=1 Tax=unclassified Microbacterium TaxID=2609290 RepID=UPI000F552392|nr:DUF6510 family protein [Microbacterium sp. ABRD28]AZC12710.1 hypothetical protein DT073_02385 [Microbacterium sp. ABRD28]